MIFEWTNIFFKKYILNNRKIFLRSLREKGFSKGVRRGGGGGGGSRVGVVTGGRGGGGGWLAQCVLVTRWFGMDCPAPVR